MANGMKNLTVAYSNEATVNIGNYQNVKHGYTLGAELEEGANPNDARAKLKATADRWLDEDIQQTQKEMNE